MDCEESQNPARDFVPGTKRADCLRRRIGRWVAFIMLVGLGVVGAGAWYLNRQANWGVVEPGKIYRSATISRFLVREKLEENKIGVIVFLSRDNGDDPDLAAEHKAAKELGVQFVNFPMNGDGVARPEQYSAALAAICQAKQQGKPVLIHCHSGAQRTGGVVAMYRILVEGKSPGDAYSELVHYGFDPKRNTTLLPFLNQHIREWAQTLADEKIIPRAPDSLPKLTP
jgi:protein-tyrosine phosphatase